MFRARSSLNIGEPQSPRPGNRRTTPQGLQRRLMGGTGRAPKRNPSRRAIRIERSTNDDQDIQRQDHRDARHLMMSCSYLAVLFADCEPPGQIRPDNGPELTANAMRQLFSRIGLQALFIDRGRPWEDGYNESFTVKTHDKLLNRGSYLYAKRGACNHCRREC